MRTSYHGALFVPPYLHVYPHNILRIFRVVVTHHWYVHVTLDASWWKDPAAELQSVILMCSLNNAFYIMSLPRRSIIPTPSLPLHCRLDWDWCRGDVTTMNQLIYVKMAIGRKSKMTTIEFIQWKYFTLHHNIWHSKLTSSCRIMITYCHGSKWCVNR